MLNVQPQKYTESVYFCPSSSLSLTCPIARIFKWPSFLQDYVPLFSIHSSLGIQTHFVPLSTKNKQANPSSTSPWEKKKKKNSKANILKPRHIRSWEVVDMCLILIMWDRGSLHMSKLKVYTVEKYIQFFVKNQPFKQVKNKATPASPSPWVKSRIHYGLLNVKVLCEEASIFLCNFF